MDYETRRYVKRQINAAARKREGITNRVVVRKVREPGSKGKRWTQDEVIEAVELCATELGIPATDLKQSQYRNWRETKIGTALPNTQTVQSRLPVRLA